MPPGRRYVHPPHIRRYDPPMTFKLNHGHGFNLFYTLKQRYSVNYDATIPSTMEYDGIPHYSRQFVPSEHVLGAHSANKDDPMAKDDEKRTQKAKQVQVHRDMQNTAESDRQIKEAAKPTAPDPQEVPVRAAEVLDIDPRHPEVNRKRR